MLEALLIFTITYILMIAIPKHRAVIAVISAAAFMILGILPPEEAMAGVEWNVILMIGGTMGVVSLFISSKMPALLADMIMHRVPDIRWAVISLSLFASIVSAFVDNVATVLMIAPVALAVAKKQNISPVPIIISISVASNLQGAATLVGDTTSILLGNYASMDFLDFFWFGGKPGIFWIVQISCAASIILLFFIFRRMRQPVVRGEMTRVTDYFPTVLMLGLVIMLIAASFLPGKPKITNGLICTGLFFIGLMRELLCGKLKSAVKAITEIDYSTLILLAALFIIIEGITHAGVIDAISHAFIALCGNNIFSAYTLIVWFSVIASAFVDNIPYVATMLPVVSVISSIIGSSPYILYYGLLVGSTLGGNLTPIGASANITAIGILEKNGFNVKSSDFMKIGVPFTFAAILTGYVLLWIIWI